MQSELMRRTRLIAETVMAYPYKVWAFAESIGVRSVWAAGVALNEPRYRDWTVSMLDRWLNRQPQIEEPDHCAPGVVLGEAYQATHDERYLRLAIRLADYLYTLPRDRSTALFHRPQHADFHHYLYVDCIEVDAPFFCALAEATGDPVYFERAVEQIEAYSHLLQDEQTGLYYHQYNGETGHVNGAFWGRGSGWALIGLLETLLCLPKNHPAWTGLHQRMLRLVAAIVACQHESGAWSTVLDQPDTYTEGSLPAIFYYGIAEGIKAQLLPEHYSVAAEKAWNALDTSIGSDGVVQGVSIGTPPGDARHYNQIAVGANVPWGQAPALLAHLTRLRLLTTNGNSTA
jgi:unsaturated rhamnogalacturonyl hydrolase